MPQAKQIDGASIGGISIATAAISANVTTTATSSGTATTLLTIGPFTATDQSYVVEVFSPGVTKGTTNISLELWVDGVFNQSMTALSVNATAILPYFWRGVVALANGSHTLTVRGFVDGGTGTFTAGTGATGAQPNATASVRAL